MAGPRILIVDDDANDRALAQREIRREFPMAPVVQIADQLSFAKAIAAGEFDLVITDYHIGWTDGVAVLREVRARYPECPVIMFTGTGSEEIAVEAMKAGLDDYVLKSVRHLARLPVAIRSALEVAGQRRALREAESRYRDLFERVPVGMFRIDAAGRFLEANGAMIQMLGYPNRNALASASALELYLAEGTNSGLGIEDWQRFLNQTDVIRNIEMPMRRLDGSERLVRFNCGVIRNPAGQISGYEGSAEDITRFHWQEEKLNFYATHDSLTGLPNRESLLAAINQSAVDQGDDIRGALLVLDVDNFSIVNDSLRYVAGDAMLIDLARRLREGVRPDDMLARVSGDDFAVLLAGANLETAWRIATGLRRRFDEHHFSAAGRQFSLGLSIGLVTFASKVDANALLAMGDAALHRAKEKGPNRIAIADPNDRALGRLSETNEWAVRVKDALRDGRFVLYYQPIVRLADGQTKHFEALIRLRAEDGRIIAPAQFIPAAEEFGLMSRVTRWVVTEALQALRSYPDLRVFVNLSGQSFADTDLLGFIEYSLERSGVAPERMGFEITETSIVQDLDLAEMWIGRLRKLGCPFALDDFGSGFSSFLYLRDLPVDQLKIDGSLVRTLGTDPVQRALVQAMHALGKTLGKEVVAEFVESESIAQVLREIGVAYGQGYHLGRPKPLEDQLVNCIKTASAAES